MCEEFERLKIDLAWKQLEKKLNVTFLLVSEVVPVLRWVVVIVT